MVNSIINSMDVNLHKLQEIVRGRGAWHAAVHGVQRVGNNLVMKQQKLLSKRTQTAINFAQACSIRRLCSGINRSLLTEVVGRKIYF